jgi:uncharacterized SAM-binding protein YcdF (DUF218 family)
MHLLKWLIVAFCLLVSLFLRTAVRGYSFLSLVFFCIAGVIVCFYLIAILKKHRPGTAKALNILLCGILCLGILIYIVTGSLILDAARGDSGKDPQYIVVLGAGLRGDSPSPILSDRIQKAYTYLTEHPDAVCIASGGQGEDEQISEAQCIFNHLTQMGIDESRIWLEDKSTSTWENFKFTLNLIEEKTGSRPEQLGVLSNDFHLFRAGIFARQCGIDPIGIPAPTSNFTLRINYYLREVAGVWHYLILGGQYHD